MSTTELEVKVAKLEEQLSRVWQWKKLQSNLDKLSSSIEDDLEVRVSKLERPWYRRWRP